jgi:membrane-bound serine protease (ClpP class)
VRRFVSLLLLLLLIPAAQLAGNGEAQFVEVLEIDGAIGPGVGDYLVEAIEEANQATPAPELLLITLDTPGGLATTLRVINLAVLASDIPVACFVYPPGSRAASAGTYLLYACHIAAMAPATTLGAATPIQIGAPVPTGGDDEKPQTPPAMEKKILNDAIAYIRSLAQLRSRNEEWAELAVREAATLTAEEALDLNVINYVASTPEELVKTMDGLVLDVNGVEMTLDTAAAELQYRKPDWRNRFITAITDPNIAYILLLIGIYGLVLEFYNPGTGVGGVIGAICLLLALYALHMLPVNFIGVALLLLGIVLLAAEAIAPSFGILGFGGVVAFVLGSIFLIDTNFEPYRIAIPVIAAVAVVSTLFLSVSLGMVWRARHGPIVSGPEAIIGAQVEALKDFEGEGEVLLGGERWQAQSAERLNKGQEAVVTAIEGLVLKVRAQDKQETDNGNTT